MLREAYDQGVAAAAERFGVKTAAGQRQMARIQSALGKSIARAQTPGAAPLAKGLLPLTENHRTFGFLPNPNKPADAAIMQSQFTPHIDAPSSTKDSLTYRLDRRKRFSDMLNNPEALKQYHATETAYAQGSTRAFPPLGEFAASLREGPGVFTDKDNTLREYLHARSGEGGMAAEKLLTSGRHSPNDVVDLPHIHTVLPGQESASPGFAPHTLAYKGGPQDTKASGPRWFSGVPSVAAGYVDKPTDRLRAYNHQQVPAEAQGPWTPHIALDPRKADASVDITKQQAGVAVVGASPYYEKVIDSSAVPSPLASYRALPTPGRFMRTQGPNVLRGEGIPSLNAKTAGPAAWAKNIGHEMFGHPIETGRQLLRGDAFKPEGLLNPAKLLWGPDHVPTPFNFDATKKHILPEGAHRAWHGVSETAGRAMPWVNRAFTIGLPAYEAYKGMKGEGDPSEGRLSNTLGAIGSGLGWAAGMPIAGQLGAPIISHLGRSLGIGAGRILGSKPTPPPQPQYDYPASPGEGTPYGPQY